MPGMELEPPSPLPLPSLLPPASGVPMLPLPYEPPSPPVRPPQLVDETPLPVKAPEVVDAGVTPTTGVGLDPFCVVLGIRAPSVTAAPAVDWGSALCPWTTGGEPSLALPWVGVLPPTLTALVGVAPLAGVVAAPPPLPDPEPASAAEPEVGVAPGVVAGLAASETAAAELVLLFPLALPFSTPLALPLFPLPFPFPFAPSLPLPLLALRPTALASVEGTSGSGDATALGTSASASSPRLSRALSLSGPSGGRRIFTARFQELGSEEG
jgi:hypothetical protein